MVDDNKSVELYVLNKGKGRYVVSKNAIDGYVKYTKTGDGCWIPDDGVVTTTSEEESDNEGIKRSSEGVTSDNEEGASDSEEVPSDNEVEVVNKGTAGVKTSGAIKGATGEDITTQMCNSTYKPSDDVVNRTKALNLYIRKLTTVNAKAVANNTIYLLSHIDIRFTHLACLLKQTTDLQVVIAGGGDENDTPTSNSLGKGLARGQWKLTNNDNNKFCYGVVQGFIDNWCEKLTTYGAGRVSYGWVGKNMSNKIINVWGAHLGNYNKSNIGGGGQAEVVGNNDPTDKTNKAGAFGIITTPLGIKDWDTSYNALYEPFGNKALIARSFTITGGNKSKSKTKKRRN